MDESFENKLSKVDLLDIYEDIADIDLPQEQLIQLCLAFTCRVNLTIGNLVYAVEKKYKNKLRNYKKSKRIKWLNVNLRSIIPHPEEKFLKWQKKHSRNEKANWIQRKLDALDYLNSESLVFYSEEPCCSRSLVLPSEGRLSYQYNVGHNESSTMGNTSSESVQTVIASQPKNTEDSFTGSLASPLINLKNVSRNSSSSSSGELPSLCFESAITSQENEAKSSQKVLSPKPHRKQILPLLHESEGLSSQEYAYSTFYQDMRVTSTQEFG